MATTVHWSVGESSLKRDSFNSIVHRTHFNAPAVLQRAQNMSRLVMLTGRARAPHLAASRPSLVIHEDRPLTEFRSNCRPQRSLSFHTKAKRGDGLGSFRMGTPTATSRGHDDRTNRFAEDVESSVTLPPPLRKSGSLPAFRKTPHPRHGFLPPDGGVIRPFLRKLSEPLAVKVQELHRRMDGDGDGLVTRQEAKMFFNKFGEVSAGAMFNEVDTDANSVLSAGEFEDFFEQVKNSGYTDEDLDVELDELLGGNVWVDFNDTRDVGSSYRKV